MPAYRRIKLKKIALERVVASKKDLFESTIGYVDYVAMTIATLYYVCDN